MLARWEKAELAAWLQHGAAAWRPLPGQAGVHAQEQRAASRPRDSRDRRPGLQALAVNALEPEWEARFEPRSYGFRPGRGCHDAIEAIYTTASGTDREAAVGARRRPGSGVRPDRSRSHLLTSLGTFPARGLMRQWLKAGVIEDGGFAPTGEGTPQGGVISPLLMNVALHGMESAAGVRYHRHGTGRDGRLPGPDPLRR